VKHPINFISPACAGMDPNMLYPESGSAIEYEPVIKEICNGCPEYSDCLEWALHNERYGYWAGTNAKDRQRIRVALNIILPLYHSEDYVDVGSIRARKSGYERSNDAA
jgi:hypothetical protein